jgi:hypothetical protein
MAIRVDFLLTDDLDGTVSPDVTTVTFGLDGLTYTIDLTVANAARLRRQLATFIGAARQVGRRVHLEGPVRGRPAA